MRWFDARRSVSFVGLVLLLCWGAPGVGAAPEATHTVWVAPDGRDTAAGTEESPYRTPARALTAVREALADAGAGAVVVVNLLPGEYRLSEPLVFGPEDSPGKHGRVIWRTAPGSGDEQAVLMGSRAVTGAWRPSSAGDGIYQVSVPFTETRQLYVDGQAAIRARTDERLAGFRPEPTPPSGGWGQAGEVTGGIAYEVTDLNPEGWRDPAGWGDLSRVEAVGIFQWRMFRVPLTGRTAGSGGGPSILTVAQPAWTNVNLYRADCTSNCTSGIKRYGDPAVWGFWKVDWFENSLAFLDEPGEWFFEPGGDSGILYYMPQAGEDVASLSVEIPVTETLIEGRGTPEEPLRNLTFENLGFRYTTWNAPSGGDGYVADQGGFLVTGENGPGEEGWRTPNVTGHVEVVTPTPGAVSFHHTHGLIFRDNHLAGIGSIGLVLGRGAQDNRVEDNTITDTASAALRLGGVSKADARPTEWDAVAGNTVEGNTILRAGRDYYDAPGVVVGFTRGTRIVGNHVSDTSWAGIAVGWGWGLLDDPPFPGVDGATADEWGGGTPALAGPTVNDDNLIQGNTIENYLQQVFDGGAVYTTGQQAHSMGTALRIVGNHAAGRGLRGNGERYPGGGNTFYTDGGSRYVVLVDNVSRDNPIGIVDLGEPPRKGDPLPYWSTPGKITIKRVPYGSEIGGCRTRGDILFYGNQWYDDTLPGADLTLDLLFILDIWKKDYSGALYSQPDRFFDVCPFEYQGVWYPVDLVFWKNEWVKPEGAD